MGIQKREFYEGAALHRLIRGAPTARITYEQPVFVLNARLQLLLKYSTAGRSPWAFTFAEDEQRMMLARAAHRPLIIGLICGADAIAALPFESFLEVAPLQSAALRVTCVRKHREHFEIRGPEGSLGKKIAPSDWERLAQLNGEAS